jgi:hypothetical protein
MTPESPDHRKEAAERNKLWACVAVNLLAFPGLGTIGAGQRFGYAQASVMVAGFLLFLGYFLWFVLGAFQFLSGGDHEAWEQHYRSGLWVGLAGLGLCVIAWFWALATSIRLMRRLLGK